jgi:repressor LexA
MAESVGDIIKRLREEKGISQRQLAALSDVDRGYINQLEAGKGGSISLRTARKLAAALEVPPDIFLKGQAVHLETPQEILQRFNLVLPESVPIYEEFPFHAGEPVEPVEYVSVAKEFTRHKNLEGYIVRGSCLSPIIEDKDIIIIDRDAEVKIGDIVACLVEGVMHLARLKRVTDELYLENNHHRMKLEEAQVAAPVVEIRRRLK